MHLKRGHYYSRELRNDWGPVRGIYIYKDLYPLHKEDGKVETVVITRGTKDVDPQGWGAMGCS